MKRYGISSWIVSTLPAEKAAEALSVSGFKEVEVSGSDSPFVKAWEQDPSGIMAGLNRAGIEVRSVHNPVDGRSLDAEDKTIRQASVDRNLEYIRLVRESGAEELVVHPRGSSSASAKEKQAASKAWSMESLAAIAEGASVAGIRLAVENLPGGMSSMGRRSVGSTVAELLEMVNGLGDHVGLCLDVGHVVLSGLDPIAELGNAGQRLSSLHLHDVSSENRDHFIPGEGRIDWESFLSALDAKNLEVIRTLEISPPAEADVTSRLSQVAAVRDKWERAS